MAGWRTVVILLFIGIVATIANAWFCWLVHRSDKGARVVWDQSPTAWPIPIEEESPPDESISRVYTTHTWRRYMQGSPWTVEVQEFRYGWPLRVMAWESVAEYPGPGRLHHALIVPGCPPNVDPGWYVLPLRPIWPNFAVITVACPAVMIPLRRLIDTRRSARRLRAGLCPRCKYPIGPSPICAECGHTVSVRHATLAHVEPT